MTSSTYKVTTVGYAVRVEPMPNREVLASAPDEIQDAVAALAAANEEGKAASFALRDARKARRLEEVPSKIAALDDAVHEAEQATHARRRDCQAAGRALVRLLDEQADTLHSRAARLEVERHVAACDGFAALVGALGGSAGPTAHRAPHELAAHVDPALQGRADLGGVEHYLDATNVEGLLERACMTAEDAGLVWMRRAGRAPVLTTPARAALAVTTNDDKEDPK